MTDTSLPPNAPVTNGTVATGHGEADGSSTTTTSPSSLQKICALLHAQVTDFLASSPPNDITRRTQEQTKIAQEVIAKALQDYE